MHIAEGFLPAGHAVGWAVAAAPFVVHGARAVAREVREHPESTLLLGAAGAFTFVLSAIKLPSITGSSSHPTGTGVGAILFRPLRCLSGALRPSAGVVTVAHGSTVVMSTNDVNLALRWADEVAVVVDRTVVQGAPEDVLGDDALLARARLGRPWALSVGDRLRELGLLPDGPLPRDVGDLLAALPQRPGVPT